MNDKEKRFVAGREVNPIFFWGVVTVVLTIVLILILNATEMRRGIYALLLVPIAAYLAIMGFFLSYLHRLSQEKGRLMRERIRQEEGRSEEFSRLNRELSEYAKQLFDKDFELTLANKRLQNLEQAKSKFVSVTTHQLRTPLSAIKWTFHMLLKGGLGEISAEQRDFVQKGYDSTQRIIAIVNDLLNVDYIDTDKADYSFIPIKLEELIDGIIFEFTNQVESKQISLEFAKPGSPLPEVSADPIKLSMVLENLIDNAIKYSPQKGKVSLFVKSDRINSARSSLEVVVADSGIGIPSGERDKIFHRFFRAPNAIKVQTDGSGLGLFISKDIVEKHGGQIWFESKEGEGTAFHFTIPIHQS